jgi:uncharacterized protein YbbC (DUF1343 family)
MVETEDEFDPTLGIPVFSLYGQVRRPTPAMMDTADVFLFDLQDLGCRIYTFVTTLLYLLEAASGTGKSVWVLDRPNPAGRPIEGLTLIPGQESFVGAGPMPMRHGLTLGEMGRWFIDHYKLDVDYRVITMEGWLPDAPARAGLAGFGWPEDRLWINPSPNAASLNMARAYAGTVMLEGTNLSEGAGRRGLWRSCSARLMWMPRLFWPKCRPLRPNGWRAALFANAGLRLRSTSMSANCAAP